MNGYQNDNDNPFNFLLAVLQSQLFNLLCDKADDYYGGRLPVHVRCLLDEFANIGQIPNFDKLIATIRCREISASIILQTQSQLKTIYKDAADTIIGNCDSMLFLGGRERTTLKEISAMLGKETIDYYNTSENRGTSMSHDISYQKTGKSLMSEDEIAVMDRTCVSGIPDYGMYGNLRGIAEQHRISDDPEAAMWTCVGYTALLVFALFKTGSVSKSVFSAH